MLHFLQKKNLEQNITHLCKNSKQYRSLFPCYCFTTQLSSKMHSSCWCIISCSMACFIRSCYLQIREWW